MRCRWLVRVVAGVAFCICQICVHMIDEIWRVRVSCVILRLLHVLCAVQTNANQQVSATHTAVWIEVFSSSHSCGSPLLTFIYLPEATHGPLYFDSPYVCAYMHCMVNAKVHQCICAIWVWFYVSAVLNAVDLHVGQGHVPMLTHCYDCNSRQVEGFGAWRRV